MFQYQYLWPPRPRKQIPLNLLTYYEQQGWIAQLKKNGTCTVLYLTPDKKVIAKTRHKTDHKLWTPGQELTDQLALLPGKDWYVFVGELLHSKTKEIKDTLYLFDLLVDEGLYLAGHTLTNRLRRLHSLFPRRAKSIRSGHYVVSPKLWVAETIKSNFEKVFLSLSAPEDEGLVLKDPQAKLNWCVSQHANCATQVKCRRAAKTAGYGQCKGS